MTNALAWMLSLVPMRVARTLARCLASCLVRFNTKTYRTTVQNIKHCLTELSLVQQQRLVKESLYHFCCDIVELGMLWHWSNKRIESKIVGIHGLSHLEKHVASSPVMLLLPHLGCWELTAFFLGPRWPSTILYSARRLAGLDQFIRKKRERWGSEMVNNSVSGIRRLIRSLQRGRVTVILPDQVPTEGRSRVASFFGRDAQTTTLIHGLLQRQDCKVLLLSVLRAENGFELQFDDVSDEVTSTNVDVSLKAMNQAIEQTVRNNPEQYQWAYKRFRRLPGQNIYAESD